MEPGGRGEVGQEAEQEVTGASAYESSVERARSNRRSENRRFTEIVAVRMTAEDKQRFTELAERHRMTLPQMFRLAAESAILQETMMEAHR